MKKYPIGSLIILGLIGVVFALALPVQAETRKAGKATAGASHATSATGLNDGGRVSIQRYPLLGNDVIVALKIDGKEVSSIGYGSSYHTFLTPGKHVLSVKATPQSSNPNWFDLTLDVHKGMTYNLTAAPMSGELILRKSR